MGCTPDIDAVTDTPYHILDVAVDATDADIKKGFRRAASKAHPDRNGGDARQMQKVNDAYALLCDPERRAKYDATGDASQGHSLLDEAKTLLSMEFAKLIDAGYPDPMHGMRQTVKRCTENAKQEQKNTRTQIHGLQRALKKLKGPSDGNFLLGVLDGKLKAAETKLKAIGNALVTFELAGTILDGYSFEVDRPAAGAFRRKK